MIIDKNGIFLTKKEASISATIIVVLALLIFVVGYFWGKQQIIDNFSEKTSQDSFNDRVDYLLTMQNFASKNNNADIALQLDLPIVPDASEECEEDVKVDAKSIDLNNESEAAVAFEKKEEQSEFLKKTAVSNKKTSAALAGFARKSLAENMQKRLSDKKIDVIIKKRSSKTASGKVTKVWYQVVTKPYSDKEELQKEVDAIVRSEKIKKSDIKYI